MEYLTQWFDTKLNRPIVHNINTMAPLLTLCFLYEETGREEYRDYCESFAEWLLDGLPKTEMGGFQHVTIGSDNNQQLWADTVFMAVLFMGKIASITGDERYAGECKKQFMLYPKNCIKTKLVRQIRQIIPLLRQAMQTALMVRYMTLILKM